MTGADNMKDLINLECDICNEDKEAKYESNGLDLCLDCYTNSIDALRDKRIYE